MHTDLIPQLQLSLKGPLPGWAAQQKMKPLDTEAYRQAKPTSKKAGVAVLLYPDLTGQLQLVYIKRPAHELDKHSGQVSFAGGQMEIGDANLQDTALRELQEELGIDRSQLVVLGALSSIYVYVSDFYVEPYVIYADKQPTFLIQESEVAFVINYPLAKILTDKPTYKDIRVRDYLLKDVPYYDINGEVLWGATAMMTAELLDLIADCTNINKG